MSKKVLFITGASSGIGAATARLAAENGWRLGLFARSADRLADLAADIGKDKALPLTGDVTQTEDLQRALDTLLEHFGGLDAAFANAGLGATVPGTERGETDNWRRMVDVNIWGLLLTAKVCLPALRESQGHMLMTGSRAGVVALKGSVYGATKWFVRGYAANLREEMAEWGGRCTLIAPGLVDTPFFDEPKPSGLIPEDVARAVVFALAQPDSVNVSEILVTPNSG